MQPTLFESQAPEEVVLLKRAVRGLSEAWSWLAQRSCTHHWVRARWDDGTYGLRCQHCMKRHGQTWNQIMDQSVPVPVEAAAAAQTSPIPLLSPAEVLPGRKLPVAGTRHTRRAAA